ncbi:hypothetical protein O4H49_12870 [Kiloniella laminariae]|uniref:ASCH domain-containing protein n=1 Tax=Kiloniella laminariae TaxID=454162 RepID=A0ABT4LKQ8_9PROT|nr:hypothetical protein [Kiloniella laminariae]MCZ4281675.1 hypothetical protein [Kiloniella laminariae]
MPAFNFQKRFATQITSGTKLSTIRAERKDKRSPAAVGDEVTLYTGMRTKNCNKLAKARISAVRTFMITNRRNNDGFDFTGYLDGMPLSETSLHQLAIADGFENAQEMIEFFDKTYSIPFAGWHISWEGLDK